MKRAALFALEFFAFALCLAAILAWFIILGA